MNRLVVVLCLLALFLAVFLWSYFAKDSYELLPMKTTLNEAPLPLKDSWFQYDAPSGDFKVSLPLLPQVADQNVLDPKTGEKRRYEMYVAQTNNGTMYMISVITLPKEVDEKGKAALLKQMMDDLVAANPQNKLVSSKNVDYQGFPALDFTIENDQALIEAKEFIRNKTVYLISTIAKKDSKEKTHFKYFIDSFQLNKN